MGRVEAPLEPNSLDSDFLARIMTQRGYPLNATSIAMALQTGATADTGLPTQRRDAQLAER
ncbi:MAG: hypothetical protein ACI9MC_003719, partial [Kiritimatiellia bacterium]